jgi:hypothetical protein
MVSSRLFVNVLLVTVITVVLMSLGFASSIIAATTGPASASNETGHLKVITHVQNTCQPRNECSAIESNDFTTHVFTFANDEYQEKGKGFPGAEKGWTVLFPSIGPEGAQYNVRQDFNRELGNVSYSSDCQGIIRARDNITCTVNNNIMFGKSFTAVPLKIVTQIHNACKPTSLCNSIHPEDFPISVFTFANNRYQEKLSGLPGAENGWTVFLIPDDQYKVVEGVKSQSLNATYSHDCQGMMGTNASGKVCIIDNILNLGTFTPKDMHNSTLRTLMTPQGIQNSTLGTPKDMHN